MVGDYAFACSWTDNPLVDYADVNAALYESFKHLKPHFSEGKARVRLSASAAHFDPAAAELEGFARPLWGLAGVLAKQQLPEVAELYRQGLSHGVDPEHSEFWGWPNDRDQRLVEMAGIAFALLVAPNALWEPLNQADKHNLITYLEYSRHKEFVGNNWIFFGVLIDLALFNLGELDSLDSVHSRLDQIDQFYLGNGWYRDGKARCADHYVPFAIHFYSMIYVRFAPADDAWRQRFIDRAKQLAQTLKYWYADDGATLPYGRSLTYRYACGAFWAGLVLADVEALPWGEIKGYLLRHLRWWQQQPIQDRDGVLSVGFSYPNLMMSEGYNSPGSPYWAFKCFALLAQDEQHPFWSAQEAHSSPQNDPVTLAEPGMIVFDREGDKIALTTGQLCLGQRAMAEKYAKFSYSSRHGFSIENDERGFTSNAFDNALALSKDGVHYRVREACVSASYIEGALRSVWQPWSDVRVETTLTTDGIWELRQHKISSPHALKLIEGGTCLAIVGREEDSIDIDETSAYVISSGEFSGAMLLNATNHSALRIHRPPANTNIIHPRTCLPQILFESAAGDLIIQTAFVTARSRENGLALWQHKPSAEIFQELDARFAKAGQCIPVFDIDI